MISQIVMIIALISIDFDHSLGLSNPLFSPLFGLNTSDFRVNTDPLPYYPK